MHDPTNSALMFDNFEISFYKTHLSLRFDNEQQPTRLIFEQWCASAPTNELSATVIEF
jgi:hypothetical protein